MTDRAPGPVRRRLLLGSALLAVAALVVVAGSALRSGADGDALLPLDRQPAGAAQVGEAPGREPLAARAADRGGHDPRGADARTPEARPEAPPVEAPPGLADLPALRARDAGEAAFVAAYRTALLRAPTELARAAPAIVADPATTTRERVGLLRAAWDLRRGLADELFRAVVTAPAASHDAPAVAFAVRRLSSVAARDTAAREALEACVWPPREHLDGGVRRRAAAALCAAIDATEVDALGARLADERDATLVAGALAALRANPRVDADALRRAVGDALLGAHPPEGDGGDTAAEGDGR